MLFAAGSVMVSYAHTVVKCFATWPCHLFPFKVNGYWLCKRWGSFRGLFFFFLGSLSLQWFLHFSTGQRLISQRGISLWGSHLPSVSHDQLIAYKTFSFITEWESDCMPSNRVLGRLEINYIFHCYQLWVSQASQDHGWMVGYCIWK